MPSNLPSNLPSAHPQIDLRGIPCPLSFVKAKLYLDKLTLGDRLEIWLDGGEPIEQVPESLSTAGHQILSLSPKDEHFVLVVQKG